MEPAEKRRKLIIGGALIATLIAVVMVDDEEDLAVRTVETVQPAKSTADKAHVDIKNIDYLEVDLLGERTFDAKAGDLFNSTSWAPERPAISLQQRAKMAQQAAERAAAPPPAPTPPPLPFKYLGKIVDGNRTQVFLADPDENYVVRLGGHIEDLYRVDAIDDETVTLTYLPLDVKQMLAINQTEAGNIR